MNENKFSVAGFEFTRYGIRNEFRHMFSDGRWISVFQPTDWKRWVAMDNNGRYLRKGNGRWLKAFGTPDTAAGAALTEWVR